jgi:flagellar motility protein MotE (MotC chaperone)
MASENLTYTEIGARLGVSPEAARGLIRRLQLPRLRTDDSNKTLVAIDFAEIRHHPTPRHQPADNQADIATLKERITALEAELCAEQQRSGGYRKDFEREWIRADRECERADRERERADRLIASHQTDIAILKERITALEAELWAEQQRSGDYRTDFERERNRADHECERADHLVELRDQLVVELEALRTLLEEASGPVAERPWRWWPRRAG